jgi:ribosomal protein L11 methyltransferase
VDPSPALVLRFSPETPAAARDRLVGVLAGHSLIAIQEDDPISPRVWTAHFADRESRDSARAAVLQQPEAASGLTLESIEVPDEDWARRTQSELPPVIVDRVTVAPPWAPAAQGGGTDRIVIVIEPSRGFGTGHHQSTRLCLKLLQRLDLEGATMVDVGTGSGVLAITAAKLGAARIDALDEDTDAVDNARENIARNGVAERVTAHVCDALSGSVPKTPADVVTANLTGTLLSRHADAVGAFVNDSGRLILSGLTADEREMVLEAFRPAFAVCDSAEEDDWWAFVLARQRSQKLRTGTGSLGCLSP